MKIESSVKYSKMESEILTQLASLTVASICR